jgi:outer membrane protein OmpA-like peptidoglycan-associated protein
VPEYSFSVKSPGNNSVDRRVSETFLLRNYIFFNQGSTNIPDRYVLLSKDQAKDFKEDQIEVLTLKKQSDRSEHEMLVYYNILNILGDRMQKNPESTIKLVGASKEGPEEAETMAYSIQTYLMNVFAIDASRIAVEGRYKPKIPSEQAGADEQIALLHQEDRRVSIESSSPVLLMEFQSGPDTHLKPVEFVSVQKDPLNSYASFNVDGADKAFDSWSIEIKDEKGIVQTFGPYTEDSVAIPEKSILGKRTSGDFTTTMVGTTKSGETLRKEAPNHLVLRSPSENEEGMKYSVIFEFNDSVVLAMYEKFLSEVLTPKIPKNGTVIIHGHTDIIGDAAYNQKLSLARANEVKGIIDKALTKTGRNDVTFKIFAFGEDLSLAPFGNELPEERFYNRTVIIDLIPEK